MKDLIIKVNVNENAIMTALKASRFGKTLHTDFEYLGLLVKLPELLKDKIKQLPDDDETAERELLIIVKIDELEDTMSADIKSRGFGIGITKELEILGILENLPDIQKEKVKKRLMAIRRI